MFASLLFVLLLAVACLCQIPSNVPCQAAANDCCHTTIAHTVVDGISYAHEICSDRPINSCTEGCDCIGSCTTSEARCSCITQSFTPSASASISPSAEATSSAMPSATPQPTSPSITKSAQINPSVSASASVPPTASRSKFPSTSSSETPTLSVGASTSPSPSIFVPTNSSGLRTGGHPPVAAVVVCVVCSCCITCVIMVCAMLCYRRLIRRRNASSHIRLAEEESETTELSELKGE